MGFSLNMPCLVLENSLHSPFEVEKWAHMFGGKQVIFELFFTVVYVPFFSFFRCVSTSLCLKHVLERDAALCDHKASKHLKALFHKLEQENERSLYVYNF